MDKLLNDFRPIKRLIFPSEDNSYVVGGSIDKIEPYSENGQMAAVPWFVIYKDGKVIRRVNAAHVETVEYE